MVKRTNNDLQNSPYLVLYSYETGFIHGFSITVIPVLRGHPWDQEKVAL